MVQNVSPTLINNTITQNNCLSSSSAANGGGLRVYASGGFNGVNNIVYGNYATTNPEYSGTVNFNYSCGATPFVGGTGNISANPQFVNANANSFYLLPTSPCINTGSPVSPLDPDSSRADMGALYFDHIGAAAVVLTMTPQNPPIQIPASGGSFNFTVMMENNETASRTFDVWIMVVLPNGSPYGPALGPINLTLGAGASISRLRTQSVPATAPPGNYTYMGNIGVYPNEFWDWDSFPFTKLTTGDGASVNGWENCGESFENISEVATAFNYKLTKVHPNPFNPQTTITYQLPANNHVRLAVFDAQGRLVANLINGWREAGSHEVTWNASGLPSGLYLCRIEAGDFSAAQKMILIK